MAPNLMHSIDIPQSPSTVDVFVIDNGSFITGFPGFSAMNPVLPGYEVCGGPSFVFLIHHPSSNTRLLFDLGVRANWRTALPPIFVTGFQKSNMEVKVSQDVADVLIAEGIPISDIDSIIFSHNHLDHTGDTTKFPPSTRIVVGPGYKEAYLPGWPANPDNLNTTSDLYEGRETVELSFSPDDPKASLIGGFKAYDYFSDGSFYILSTPGHTIGHLSALARTTSHGVESTFIFLGGDIVHSNAVFRPTSKLPLPDHIPAPNARPFTSKTCPGEYFAKLHRLYSETDGKSLARNTPFSRVVGREHDLEESQRSADKMAVFDGEENILLIWAHDVSLHDVLQFFPEKANGWKEKGWKQEGHWRWLAPCMEQEGKASKL